MLRSCLSVAVVAAAVWASSFGVAFAHERAYEFEDTHVAVSIERFMGVDYTEYEGRDGDTSARLFLNASEPAPTSLARLGVDVFFHRLSLGIAGGVTSDDVAILAPRVGYMFGLTPQLGLWLRGGAFFADAGPSYTGIYAEALLGWFPYNSVAITFGPTLDVAFAEDDYADYVSIGIPEVGLSVWF